MTIQEKRSDRESTWVRGHNREGRRRLKAIRAFPHRSSLPSGALNPGLSGSRRRRRRPRYGRLSARASSAWEGGWYHGASLRPFVGRAAFLFPLRSCGGHFAPILPRTTARSTTAFGGDPLKLVQFSISAQSALDALRHDGGSLCWYFDLSVIASRCHLPFARGGKRDSGRQGTCG